MTDDLREQLQTALGADYTIERELGGGGMSRVFVATEVALGRRVVLKVLRPEIAESVSVERFRRETLLAARLQHPHIVPLFGGGEAGPFLYYTMPLVEGESLRVRLEGERPLPVADALRLAREAAEALAYAHERGVVHRDVKPENILLSGGHALVTDFGIARAVDRTGGERLTTVGVVIGTPAYMSPEQASGETELDARSDIYSLGCVLYEMLAGAAPFTGPSVQAIIARRFTERAPSVRTTRPDIPAEVDELTARAMATLREERFSTATELARALDDVALRVATARALSGETERRASVTATQARPATHRLGIAAAALVTLAAAAWSIARPRTADRASTPDATPSVAVLYLQNQSPDTADAYLADGLTEEITSRLTRIGQLRVKSRGAVARLRTSTLGPADAGRTLDVAYVVSGSVRRLGDSLKASVQLVRVDDESEVWSDEYEIPRTALVTLQDSIAEQVALKAGATLSPGDHAALTRHALVNPDAYDHYLRAKFQLARRTPPSVARAIEEYRTAHRIDSTLTDALAGEGYAYAVFADWGWAHPDGLTREEQLRRGLDAANAALRQDSTNAEAWLARAHLLFLQHPRTLDGVVPAFEQAVRLDSANAEAQYQYGQALMAVGLTARAIDHYRSAIRLEPDWASPLMSLGALVSRSHQYTTALRWLDSAVAVDPSSSYSFVARASTRVSAGLAALAFEDAVSALRTAAGYRVPPYAAMAMARAATGDTALARAWADSAFRATPDTAHLSATDAFYIAAAFVRAGQTSRGLSMLERSDPESAWLWFYMTSPIFDPVRTEPRFMRVSDRSKPPGAAR